MSVSFEDVRRVTPACMRHRIILNFEGEAEGVEADSIITEILKATKEA